MSTNENNLVWLDLEMTGLNSLQDRILEIATIVTDAQLNILSEGPVFAIHQSDTVLEKMNSWCKEHHGQSGLIERVQKSQFTENQAELETLAFIKKYVPAKTSPLCGNSIYQDRRFLFQFMPTLEDYFHYRLLDVSTVKILAQRWAPTLAEGFKKESTHTALQDIRDSIEELRYYKKYLFAQ
ncbi:MAG: oligoribonuclease [Gammaproteobacteria bacterium RIFCSPHIGHO2_12_FULL_42_13]|nr:MAG: oligoribonuclease [Gammaproteobacteria bacterium RIFCSPHIGHO2_12_FULL_42_13]